MTVNQIAAHLGHSHRDRKPSQRLWAAQAFRRSGNAAGARGHGGYQETQVGVIVGTVAGAVPRRHMPGPLYAPTVFFCYPVRYRSELTGRVKARYKAERHELIARYIEWEIIGEPELRWPQEGSGAFNPWK